jgi:hypothetical protein
LSASSSSPEFAKATLRFTKNETEGTRGKRRKRRAHQWRSHSRRRLGGVWLCSAVERNPIEIQISRNTKLGLGLDDLDAKKRLRGRASAM